MSGQVGMERLSADVVVVTLTGEHDLVTAPRVGRSVAEAFASDARVLLDVAEATFIDSTIIAVMFEAVKQAATTSGETLAFIVTPGSDVDRTLGVVGFTPAFVAMYPTRDAALAAWREHAS